MIIPQRSFSSGELSPTLYPRVDYFRYQTGAKIIRNCYVRKSGGVENRPGTEYVSELSLASAGRLIPFVFSSTQTYVLEFQNLKMRVHKNGVLQTTSPTAIFSISAAAGAVLTYSGADVFATSDYVKISGIDTDNYPGGFLYNNREFKIGVVNTVADTFPLNYPLGGAVVSTEAVGFIAGTGMVSKVYELTTTYATADLADLKYSQSGDKMLITHPSYPPRELVRISDTSWTITDVSFVPAQAAPTSGAATPVGVAGAVTYKYKLTAINDTTGEESLATASFETTTGNATLSSANYNNITYTPASGATYHNVFKLRNGTYGFIGVSSAGTFDDIGYAGDTSDTPPLQRTPFTGANNYPSCVSYTQQRAAYGNTNTNTELVELSQTGAFKNFTKSNPSRDSDSISFSSVGAQVSSVRHIMELDNFILFCENSEKVCLGNSDGTITPTEINPKTRSYNGSANNPAPIAIDTTAIYVQKGGSIIRDFFSEIAVDGYKGNDLTTFSEHLLKGRIISDWAYQKLPNSIIWIVRDDGVVLSLTYVKEHQILAMCRHDFTDGFVENVCSIPNGDSYDVYFVVRRRVMQFNATPSDEADGITGAIVTRRYVERMTARDIFDENVTIRIEETQLGYGATDRDVVRKYSNDKKKVFCDAAITYNGWNTNLANMIKFTLIIGQPTGWLAGESVMITARVAGTFSEFDVGRQIHARDSNGVLYKLSLTEFQGDQTFWAESDRDMPQEWIDEEETSDWAFAVDRVEGAWHLEGLEVSIIGDGEVVASPNNPDYDVAVVTGGMANIPECCAIIHVGIPYTSDIETLAIDQTGADTSMDKKTLIKSLTLHVENTRGVFAGSRNPDEDKTNTTDDLLHNLTPLKTSDFEDYDSTNDLIQGKGDIKINSKWDNNGRGFLRQIDPSPMTILSIAPEGNMPFGK